MMTNNYDGLRKIFNQEIGDEKNNLSAETVLMMDYITSSEENFNAFHLICAFLLSNYANEFLTSMGIPSMKLDLNESKLPKNKIN